MSDNRDWQADMELASRPEFANSKMTMYWLQQYAAEKQRADKLEELLSGEVAKLWAEVSKGTENNSIYNIMNFRLRLAEAREKRLIEFIIKVMNTPDVDKEDLGIEARVFLQKLYGGVPVMDKEAEA